MFGSLSKLSSRQHGSIPPTSTFPSAYSSLPLDACQDRRNVISRTPSVLKNVEAEFASGVDVGVEHLRDELDAWRLVGVRLLKVHHQPECAILERRISGADDHGIPVQNPHEYSGHIPSIAAVSRTMTIGGHESGSERGGGRTGRCTMS